MKLTKQLSAQLKVPKVLSALTGLVLVGTLSACGGGSGDSFKQDFSQKPVTPVVKTQFGRIGMDVKLFGGTQVGILPKASVDTSANITFQSGDAFSAFGSYNFTFPSGLPGGSIGGNFFTTDIRASNIALGILTPSKTKNVQNVLWRNNKDLTLFGISLAGYMAKPGETLIPTTGKAIFSGKAFQYFVDSNATTPASTTYALYTSNVTASVDYAAGTIEIAVAPNPEWIGNVGNADVLNADTTKFATNYTMSGLKFAEESYFQSDAKTLPQSNFGLAQLTNGLSFFGNNAEELGGFIHYQGDVSLPAGTVSRDQYISFALVKQ